MGTSPAIPVRAALLAFACCVAGILLLAAPAPAHEDPVQVITSWEPDVDGEGLIPVSRHLDPLGDFTSDRAGKTAAVPLAARNPTDRAIGDLICTGLPRSTDDLTNAYHPATSRVIKVIYAYPTDVGNRLATYAPVIQAGVRWVSELAAGESGNLKSLRFDLGTATGKSCLDIQTVALTRTASAYTANSSQTFSMLRTELLPKVTGQPGARNFLVYADGVTVPNVGGEAQVRGDDTFAGAQQGLGNLWAMVYGRGGTDFVGSKTAFVPGTTSRAHVDIALHEISHTLGAVQRSAPHRSAAFHCVDEHDILCYDDDGSGGISTSIVCNNPGAQYWDCNKDDYFNPNPAPGSYLATHWNLFNSVFLCPAAQCAPGGVTGPPISQPVPWQPPETTIVSGPKRRSKSRTVVFRFRSNDTDAHFQCQVDGARYRECSSPLKLRLSNGKHRFSVYAYVPSPYAEVGGEVNADDSPAQSSFKVKGKKKK